MTDVAALHIKAIRENTLGENTTKKEELLTAFADSIRLAEIVRNDKNLQPLESDIDNIQSVLADYWELRRDVEDCNF